MATRIINDSRVSVFGAVVVGAVITFLGMLSVVVAENHAVPAMAAGTCDSDEE